MHDNVFTVTQVNNYIKNILDDDPYLGNVVVRGEMSNFKAYPSGHWYFSLKDENCSIRCVMFKGDAMRVRYRPENGMSFIAAGRVTVYPRDGQYQLYCTMLEPDGLGALYAAFEQLKTKLAAQGLFDPARKKPLPRFPEKIALITSPAGAAVRDMIRIAGRRFPYSKIVIVPVRVQGAEAPGEIATAIALANALELADVIITGRGGGSLEDLWAFNDEQVAMAIADSRIPVISAVGHEPDVTISDFVADARASTPSNAAEIALPDAMELRDRVMSLRRSMEISVESLIKSKRNRLERAAGGILSRGPGGYVAERRVALDMLSQRLIAAVSGEVSARRMKTAALAASLDAMSPLKVLSRGYAVAIGERGVMTDADQASPGDKIELTLHRGSLKCEVYEVNK
ncbi:MAG: exodeoxyribonuclease VII large subunit [Oscillospiraceae bacterium]|nr:exodeoxyribonuclease VII large subunit [Oscillospiraceae bacterium]